MVLQLTRLRNKNFDCEMTPHELSMNKKVKKANEDLLKFIRGISPEIEGLDLYDILSSNKLDNLSFEQLIKKLEESGQ